MPTKLNTTEEKLDAILKYQKRTYRWAVARGIISVLFFLIFIVFPIIGGLYLASYVKENFTLEKIQQMQEQFKEFQNFGDAFSNQFKDLEEVFRSN